jgi:pimeloyl-ACP methyl ester carboxylesterase
MAALQLPRVLRQRGCGSINYFAERNARYPVLLVHGYAANETMWTPLRRALAATGFGHIVSLTYNSFATDPETVAAELAHQALRALTATGAPQVHLVGHSLGGLIIHCALAESAALSSQAASVVTIASPHGGTHLARIAPGRCARIMRQGSSSCLSEAGAPRPARWLAYYSDGDRFVPPASARLDDARYGAANLLIPRCGHLTICRDVRLIRSLVPELVRTETFADLTAPTGAGQEPMAALCCPP